MYDGVYACSVVKFERFMLWGIFFEQNLETG
jgi:hypothetical protein